jgi:uncharacterized protein
MLVTAGPLRDADRSSLDSLIAPNDFPFLQASFLALLQSSGSTGGDTGWQDRHLSIHDDKSKDTLLGFVPAFLRDDSYGEFVFDFQLAQASRRFGVQYYPKWTVAVPFTPATGPRLLAGTDDHKATLAQALIAGSKRDKASSVHVLFCEDDDARVLHDSGFVRRHGLQFHWYNDNYTSYDDFLSRLRAEDRKQLKRERRRVVESGLEIRTRLAKDVTEAELSRLFDLYTSTSDRKWGKPYLTRAFFLGLPEALGDSALFVTAHAEGETVAMTLSFEKGRHIFGRYWGTFVDVPGLHFELCYHQLIDRAIANGVARVEAGAQGEHKLKRGFLPMLTTSMHFFHQPQFHAAVGAAYAQEMQAVRDEVTSYRGHSPFRDGAAPAAAQAIWERQGL